MGDIKLTYGWSESRVKMLRSCMRQYYYNYFLSWGGWKSNAPQDSKTAYMLKNMTNMPMFVGSVVHDTLEEIIRFGRNTQTWVKEEDAQKKAIQKLRKGWLDSENRKWQQSPKNYVNLFEHYYQQDIPKDKLSSYKEKVLKCIEAFYKSDIYDLLIKLRKKDWLSLEQFQDFNLKTGERVTLKIDLAFKYGGKIFLIDWKTGQINDAVIDQLITYAMYAMKKGWAKKVEDIIIIPSYLAFYLNIGDDAMPKLSVTLEQIQRQALIIKKEYPIIEEAYNHRDDIEFFKRTHDEKMCQRCNFRAICPGAVTEIGEEETPF